MALNVLPGIMKSLKRWLYITGGILSVGFGILGIFLPLLPTTVFFLLAAFCFSRSSEKFYYWLLHNRWFGRYIKNYREKRGVSIRLKIFSISILWLTILSSTLFFVQNIYVKILLIIIAIGVTVHLLTIRTFKSEKRHTSDDIINSGKGKQSN